MTDPPRHCFPWKRHTIFLALVFGLTISYLRAAAPIRAGCERDYPPFCDVDAAGKAVGFSVELLRETLAAMNREAEFVTGTWAKLKAALERGDLDALPLVGRTPEREASFDFTFPYLSLHGVIVVRSDTPGIDTLEDLRGRAVAVMAQDNVEEFLRRETEGLRIRPRPGFPEALRELSAGEHDAVVMQRLVALHLVRELGLDNLRVLNHAIEGFRQDFCLAVRQGDADTLALLNEGLSIVMADGTFRRLHARWFSDLNSLPRRRIVVGGDHAYPPFEFLDGDGRASGMNTEITRALARKTGLDVAVRLGPWETMVSELASGGVDVLQGMFFTPERDRRFDFSPPYAINEYVTVTRRGNADRIPASFEDLRGRTVAVQTDDAAHHVLLASGNRELQLLPVASQEDVLRAVHEGRVDCGLTARRTAAHFLRENAWKNLRLGTDSLMSLEYCYAVRQGDQTLLGRINEGLALLDDSGELREIRHKWLGPGEDGSLGFLGFMRYFGLALVPLVLLALGFMFWSWLLRRKVALRTVELRESEQFIRTVLDHLPLGIAVIRNDPGNVVFDYMNEHFPRIYRTTRAALSRPNAFWESVYEDPEFRARIRERIVADCASGDPGRMQWEALPLARRGEATSYVSARNIPIPGRPYFISMVWDVTAQHRDTLRIRNLNRVLRTIRDINQLIVRERDPAVLIRRGCDILVKHRGYVSALIILTDEKDRPLSWAGAGQPEDTNRWFQVLETGKLPPCCAEVPANGEARLMAHGEQICEACSAAPKCALTGSLCARLVQGRRFHGYLMAMLNPEADVADEERELFSEMAGDLAYALHNIRIDDQRRASERERHSLSEQLAQAQKMEAVGRLAGSVAHDFNNLLMGIQGYAELSREILAEEHPARKFLEEIIAGVQRSTELTRQLLAFARRQPVTPKVMDINQSVGDLRSLLQRLVGERITLEWTPGENLWTVKVDPSQIDQIMTNLCINARDAMNGEGRIAIATENVVVDEDFSAEHPDAEVGEYVMIRVSDNGQGMKPDVLEHIFEPFFTTKEKGKGTGLGLATVYGITRQNHGFVTVNSVFGKGTTFRVYFPRCEETVAGKEDEVTETPVAAGRGETLLVADDEPLLLRVIENYLGGLGYEVLTANAAEEALRLAENHAGRIDLLISDMVMPGLSGDELARRLLERHPRLKCLFLSGDVEEATLDLETLGRRNTHFVQKPVAMQTLAAKVREMLDEAP